MKMFLTCAKCGRGWTVVRWAPAVMRCPKCGSERYSDGITGVVSTQERDLAAAEQKESARLTRAEQREKAQP